MGRRSVRPSTLMYSYSLDAVLSIGNVGVKDTVVTAESPNSAVFLPLLESYPDSVVQSVLSLQNDALFSAFLLLWQIVLEIMSISI